MKPLTMGDVLSNNCPNGHRMCTRISCWDPDIILPPSMGGTKKPRVSKKTTGYSINGNNSVFSLKLIREALEKISKENDLPGIQVFVLNELVVLFHGIEQYWIGTVETTFPAPDLNSGQYWIKFSAPDTVHSGVKGHQNNMFHLIADEDQFIPEALKFRTIFINREPEHKRYLLT